MTVHVHAVDIPNLEIHERLCMRVYVDGVYCVCVCVCHGVLCVCVCVCHGVLCVCVNMCVCVCVRIVGVTGL